MGGDLAQAAALLGAGVNAVLAVDLSAASRTEVTAFLRACEAQRRRLEAADHAVIAELDQRGIAGEYGHTSTVDLLIEQLRLAPAEAKARVQAARDLGPRRGLGGEPLDPIFPHAAAAVAHGTIGTGHSRVITHCLDALPPHLDAEVVQRAETALVEHARHLDPRTLTHVAQRLIATLDPDGVESRADEQHRRRGFGIRITRDGTGIPLRTTHRRNLRGLEPHPGRPVRPATRTPGQRGTRRPQRRPAPP
jgi:Domain of unknown function (DUF222)